jgi:hypothetical protein
VSLLRRISETVKRLTGKKRERPVKEAPPFKAGRNAARKVRRERRKQRRAA